MPDFTSGEYFNFNYNYQVPKSHDKVFILNQESDFYITSAFKLKE